MGSRGKHVPLPQTDTTLTNENQSNSGSKRISFYDNFNDNGLDFENSTRNEGRYELQELNFERERSPTQVYLMNTTVPQNIGDITLGDRHAPTRNSLRHSRMIVMSRNGNGIKSLKFIFKSLGSQTLKLVFFKQYIAYSVRSPLNH